MKEKQERKEKPPIGLLRQSLGPLILNLDLATTEGQVHPVLLPGAPQAGQIKAKQLAPARKADASPVVSDAIWGCLAFDGPQQHSRKEQRDVPTGKNVPFLEVPRVLFL